MVVYETDLKRSAVYALENCLSFLKAGDMKKAHQCFGEARAYEDMLFDDGIDIESESQYYREIRAFYLMRTASAT